MMIHCLEMPETGKYVISDAVRNRFDNILDHKVDIILVSIM